jgi:hypothetical protein
MNTAHCLVCKLIQSRTEMIEEGMLLLKRGHFDTPALSLAAVNGLRSKPVYTLGNCCQIDQQRLTRSEHELELELARLKLRAGQLSCQQESTDARDGFKISLA